MADFESGITEGDRIELRIWLRLLTCCNLLESRVRQNLQREFSTTLPRFDVLAQLYRESPLSMSELSRRTMVSNGNITGLVARLAQEGLVARKPARDRRVQMVELTGEGRKQFEEQAHKHRAWIGAMMDGLSSDDMRTLQALLAKMKSSVLASDQQRLEAAE
jgi:DNA-binding MarR family transcriptional regulator